MPNSRQEPSSIWCTGIVARASGTSSGAPARTKSFCISTTSSAGWANLSIVMHSLRGQRANATLVFWQHRFCKAETTLPGCAHRTARLTSDPPHHAERDALHESVVRLLAVCQPRGMRLFPDEISVGPADHEQPGGSE